MKSKLYHKQKPKKLRAKTIKNFYFSFLGSHLLQSLFLTISAIVAATLHFGRVGSDNSIFQNILTISMFFITSVFFYMNLKKIVFEILVMVHIVESSMGQFNWYNEIEKDRIFLGAIPLKSMNHMQKMLTELQIDCVISILEKFEMNSSNLAGDSVSPEDWKGNDINHLWLQSPDFFPPSLELLDRGADFIYENVHLLKKRVYVHCKSGMGRSASLVIAYYIKYRKLNALKAHEFVISKRSVIFGLKSTQMRRLLEYERTVLEKASLSNSEMEQVIV